MTEPRNTDTLDEDGALRLLRDLLRSAEDDVREARTLAVRLLDHLTRLARDHGCPELTRNLINKAEKAMHEWDHE